jgi:hypothetical protein
MTRTAGEPHDLYAGHIGVATGGDTVRFFVPTLMLPWLVVTGLGCVEGLYGRTQYAGDWISYLNVSRAISALNWPAIFDPMWNPGYPALVAFARGFAPSTPEGEWYAITVLNVLIFLGAYGAWRHLIRAAIAFYRPDSIAMANHPAAIWTTTWLFLGCGLGLENVSSVSPDLLVTMGFLLATAQVLRVIQSRTELDAAALGLLLGIAVWVKGVFSVLALIFLLVIFLDCFARRAGWRSLIASAGPYLVLFACYVAAISWSYGTLTFGATGALNYAFHVNHLPHWTNWQGGPYPLGTPIHPTRQLFPDLPAFEFATPFQSTYPPYNNLAYWYQGFRPAPSLKLQVLAAVRSLYVLASITRHHPILIGTALALLTSLLAHAWREAVSKAAKSCWPLFLPALLGGATYLSVHLEDRYIGPFVLVLGLLPLAPLLNPQLPRRRSLAAATAVIIAVAAVAEVAQTNGGTIRAALRGTDFHDDPQWKLAAALSAYGLRKGDRVAVIRNTDPPYLVHWAYVSGLRIIAEFGAVPWRVNYDEPRQLSQLLGEPNNVLDPGDVDYGKLFWTELTPARRASVIQAFRVAGADAVISLSRPEGAPGPGWRELNGGKQLIYDFKH